MNIPGSMETIVAPVISMVPRPELRDALREAFAQERDAVETIEDFFQLLPSAAWSKDLLCTFAGSWKATHLKMLAIYGLSCRLQKAANDVSGSAQSNLLMAAARNAETSYEDLGIDADGRMHSDLFEEFAGTLTGGDLWQLRNHCLPEARAFNRWIYRNMVVEAIPDGLLTNMFSEIYNHGEYSLALPAADAYFRRHTHLGVHERRRATAYIAVHVENDTEADHFMVVVDALDRYAIASGAKFDAGRAVSVFRAYLRNVAPVMQRLSEMMRIESADETDERLPA